MEKSRHRSYTVNSRNRQYPVPPQESKHVHRERRFPNLSPDSVSCGGGVAEKDSSTFKFGWRSSKQLFGTPIKKLVADEMSRETEFKRRSPGVIARLMGLDGLPFQQPANKQKNDSSESHGQRETQAEKARSRGTSFDGGWSSSRRSSKDQQEFKDVFEVSEIPKVESNRYSSHLYSEDLKNNEAEMSFIEQKFMDAKRLATYQDLQSSKDFHDTLEVLDSNKDLLLKYFKRPDSLFKKHLNDLQAAPLQSHFGHAEALELSDIEKYEHDISWRSDRETARLSYDRYHQKHHDAYPSQFDRRHGMHSSPKSSKLQGKLSKPELDAGPTKIVVLKPNLGKVQNGARVISSPCSPRTFLSEHGNDTEFSDATIRDARLYHQKNRLPDTVRHLRQNSLEARELSKEVTRQVKNSLNNGCAVFSSSRFRGYAGDDSSCSNSGNESPAESRGTSATMGSSIDLNNSSRRSSHSSESSVSREAKKRLSERWKIAHKSQEGEIISRSSTLAEMLAVSDKEVKSANFDSMSTSEGLHNNFAGTGEPGRPVEPLGISSKDGWKDGCIASFPRSRSLPASSTVFGSPRATLRNEAVHDDRFMMPKEMLKRERRRGSRSLDHRHSVNTRSTKSGHKKSWSLNSSQPEDDDFLPDSNTIQNKMKVKPEEDSPILEVLAAESFAEPPIDTSEFSDTVVIVANENADRLSEPSTDKVLPELSSCDLIKGNNSAAERDNSMKQQLNGVEYSSCKDIDQPSPISVLEPSLTDDLSSCSECFESLSADLQGLRMQLHLLKMESEGYADGPMPISSDEDGVEASTEIPKDNNRLCRTEDSWESSYIIDVLSESGIDGAQPDTIIEAWHSLDRPVSLSVFDNLENKYCDWTTCSRSERRLLFDRINSGILKIHEQLLNPVPWVGSATTNVGSKLMENGLQDALCNMVGSQGKVKDDALGKVLVGESEWLELRNEIDLVGREIEGLLLDDLVAEIAHIC